MNISRYRFHPQNGILIWVISFKVSHDNRGFRNCSEDETIWDFWHIFP